MADRPSGLHHQLAARIGERLGLGKRNRSVCQRAGAAGRADVGNSRGDVRVVTRSGSSASSRSVGIKMITLQCVAPFSVEDILASHTLG